MNSLTVLLVPVLIISSYFNRNTSGNAEALTGFDRTLHRANGKTTISASGTLLNTSGSDILSGSSMLVPVGKQMNGNNISAWYFNNGIFNNRFGTGAGGFEWPKGSNKTAKYSSGIIVLGIAGIDTVMAVSDYGSEFLPGQTIGGIPQGNGNPAFKVYKLIYGVNDSDRANWPNLQLGNSDQGAPIYFDSVAGVLLPNDFGNQTMFYCYTDSYADSHTHFLGSTDPMKCDVKQITYCFNQPEELKNTIYQEYRIINRGNVQWRDLYFTFFSDDDLGDAQDDAESIDSALGLSYTYNYDDVDFEYGASPPATGFVVIRSPCLHTGMSSDSLFYYEGRKSRFKTGVKEAGISSNIIFHDDTWQPQNRRELHNTVKGLKKDGNDYINPVNGQPTKFMYSGDPVTNSGWIQHSTGDMRFYMNFGPFTMNPGDTQFVVIAQVIARGDSRLNSITRLRETAQFAKDFYDNMFQGITINIVRLNENVPSGHKLYDNFPNPFNSQTSVIFDVAQTANVNISVFDMTGKKVDELMNRTADAGSYKINFNAEGLSTGVYILRMTADAFTQSKRIIYLK